MKNKGSVVAKSILKENRIENPLSSIEINYKAQKLRHCIRTYSSMCKNR